MAAFLGPPSLSWYHVIPSQIQPRARVQIRLWLRSGDDYTISIDEYRYTSTSTALDCVENSVIRIEESTYGVTYVTYLAC